MREAERSLVQRKGANFFSSSTDMPLGLAGRGGGAGRGAGPEVGLGQRQGVGQGWV